MNGELRRALPWWLLLGFTSGFACGVVLLRHTRRGLFYFPPGEALDDLFPVLFGIGLAFGLFVGLHDRLTGTEDYLRHRPQAAGRVALRRHGLALGLIAASYLGALLFRRFHHWDSEYDWDGSSLAVHDRGERWAALTALGTLAWSAYAIAFHASRTPGGHGRRSLLGVASLWFLVVVSHAFLEDAWRLTPMSFATIQIALTALALLVAQRHERRGEDLDRPSERSVLVLNLLFMGMLMATLAGLVAARIQGSALESLRVGWPEIHARPDGSFALLRPYHWSHPKRRTALVDEGHQPIDASANGLQDPETFVFRLDGPGARQSLGWEPYRLELGLGRRETVRDLNANLGFAMSIHGGRILIGARARSSDPSKDSEVAEVHRPDGRSFSSETRLVPFDFGACTDPVLFDPADDSTWLIVDYRNSHDCALVRLEISDDDEPLEIKVDWPGPMPDGLPRVFGGPEQGWRDSVYYDAWVLGRRGAYYYYNHRFRRVDHPVARLRYRAVVEDSDSIAPVVALRDREGTEVFRHHYGAYTEEERDNRRKAIAASFLRSPLALLVSTFFGPPRFLDQGRSNLGLIDPLVAGGRRLGLTAAVWALGLVLAFLQDRRLRFIGAEPARRRLWFAAGVLGGLAVFLLGLLVERPRAHRHLSRPSSAPVLLKSA